MDFSMHLDVLMKPFIKVLGKCEKTRLTPTDQKNYKTLLIALYQEIYKSNEEVFSVGCFKHELIKESAAFKRPGDYSHSRYFPLPIQHYIKENEYQQLVFSCGNVGGREIYVNFTLFAKIDSAQIANYVQQVRLMYVWLNICANHARTTCATRLDIYIYPTPFTKNLPGSTTTVLGPEHVNTAFTFACAPQGELIIYREEEWFKVFIHETFHAFGLDFAQSDVKELKKTLQSLFPIESEFDLHEAYTETWARLINCALCSFNALIQEKEKEKDKTKNQKISKRDSEVFIQNFNFCVEIERLFALYQCTKVLSFMGLHYKDIREKSNYLRDKLYKENTHVFAYYIMTAIFLNDYQGFILWCKEHNKDLMQFDSSPTNLQAFAEYITKVYQCQTLLDGIDYMGKMNAQMTKGNKKNERLIKTTRMSIIHTL